MTRRLLAVLAVALGGIPVLLASPAAAATYGGWRDTGMTVPSLLLVFVGIPIAIVGLISAVIVVPQMMRRPRYRPGRPWPHDPLWFAGPEEPDAAVGAARPRSGTGGAGGRW